MNFFSSNEYFKHPICLAIIRTFLQLCKDGSEADFLGVSLVLTTLLCDVGKVP